MLWQIVLRLIEVLVVLGGAGASLYSGRLWLQAQKQESIASAKDQVIRLLTISVEAWKSRYDVEHLEIGSYRAEMHGKADIANKTIIDLTNANAELRIKTDLTPVMKMMEAFIKEQTAINAKILSALTNLEARTNGAPALAH